MPTSRSALVRATSSVRKSAARLLRRESWQARRRRFVRRRKGTYALQSVGAGAVQRYLRGPALSRAGRRRSRSEPFFFSQPAIVSGPSGACRANRRRFSRCVTISGAGFTRRVSRPNRVMNLWASWCPPCRAEMPDFQRLADAYGKPRGIAVVGVNEGESRSARVHSPVAANPLSDLDRLVRADTAAAYKRSVCPRP